MKVFHNAVVYTAGKFAQAFAVENGRFVFVGSHAEAPEGERIDQAGTYASFEEHIKGRIIPGNYANFTVLGTDPFHSGPMQIKDIPVLQT